MLNQLKQISHTKLKFIILKEVFDLLLFLFEVCLN